MDIFRRGTLWALDTDQADGRVRPLPGGKARQVFPLYDTTNGVLLDQDTIDYINREMSNVVLSLDGRREVNDHMRPTVNGKGSYDVIVPKFQQLVSQRGTKDYYVRGTFTRETWTLPTTWSTWLPWVPPCFGGTVQRTLDDPFAIKEGDLPAVEAEYEKLAGSCRGGRT